ncbi:bifunctional deaminase-reductase domain protein [Xylanimonas cellulosilytica DSM 15894]|uniref:Bifunctional deaminase-reductase domain protein n=1 Tax=Xylanimonas cellulosilytica (strain DSM 15894 / JCM 12276 / CECT 5975 / KCTC 9989 / LMG 20990 / NBRC 107835 / XIL07) TaxID=446471 RepID=D1BU56_XYLCX|nr:dihydrofolate reductase family protein [Xylanimonas cellulosilytica]ACZ29220.1 bifunctional deaminase-reductase domain protein [Xylanimonas cellulosilytica DSM 15894]
MGRIVSTLFSSLDGVVEIDPEWHFPYFDDQMGAAVTDDYAGVGAILLGRVTYDSFVGAWPDREAAGEEDAGFAKLIGDTRKIVATRGTGDLGWRNVEATPDVVATAQALRADQGVEKVIVPGSITIVRELLAAGLLDELRLLVHPIAARTGERLFDEGAERYPMRLVSAEPFDSGVVRLIYAPTTPPEAKTYDDVKQHDMPQPD